MTRDLSVATVFVSVYADEPARTETLEGLQAVAPTLRGRVGQALRLRIAPMIVFRLDESIAHAARIESLLNSVRPPVDPPGPEPTADGDDADR